MGMRIGRYGALTLILSAFLCAIGMVLGINYLFANGAAEATAAARAIGEQQLQPRVVAAETQILRNDLTARRYLGRGLEQLKTTVAELDAAVKQLDEQANKTPGSVTELLSFSALASAQSKQNLQNLRQLWNEYHKLLKPVVSFNTDAYVETADRGTQLSSAGARLSRDLEAATRFGGARHAQMAKLIGDLSQGVETATRERAATLQAWLLTGLGGAVVLLIGTMVFIRFVSRKEQAASRAKTETDDILRTVNQGLFLLDDGLKLGSERSEALEHIFHRTDFEKLTFESLLRGVVPDKTLETAKEYVKLLWGERVNEKLIKSINPLSEVEVNIDSGAGSSDTQYLEFDFNRVRADGKMSRILVTVNDVTRRVHLARELQESQEKAQAQLDLLLHILHVEPRQLSGFLEESDVAMKMVNSILREPAREETAFRAKLDGIFRQVHSVKGEAAALGLKTVEQRAHSFEEALSELRSRPALSGNDFLPLVVKLDDLFSHLAQVREMVGRLSDLRVAMSGDSEPTLAGHRIEGGTGPEGTLITPAPVFLDRMLSTPEPAGLEGTLEALAGRIAKEHSKQVALNCSGLNRVPDKYRRAVKDIAIQMVRNSLTHGIETPAERQGQKKAAKGAVTLRFEDRGAGGFEFVCQDDGRGLSVERLKATAVEKGLMSAEQVAKLDDRRALSLIFMAGFSTQKDVTKDAGRGVGMDLVRNLVQEMGGKLGVSTTVGKFVRFRIWLPAVSEVRAA